MAYESRMNSLKLSTSSRKDASPVKTVSNMGTLGAKVPSIHKPANPGPMTSPSNQGFERKK